MLISQTGEPFTAYCELQAAGTFPAHCSAEQAVVHIQGAVVCKNFAFIQAKTLIVNEQFERQPVRNICQFLFPDRDAVEDAKEQCSGVIAGIVFLECATCTEIAVADSIYR